MKNSFNKNFRNNGNHENTQSKMNQIYNKWILTNGSLIEEDPRELQYSGKKMLIPRPQKARPAHERRATTRVSVVQSIRLLPSNQRQQYAHATVLPSCGFNTKHFIFEI